MNKDDWDEILLTTDELAKRWRYTTDNLANMRSRRVGIPFIKLPGGAIRYRASDVLEAEMSGLRGLTMQRVADAVRQCPLINETTRPKVARWLREQLMRR